MARQFGCQVAHIVETADDSGSDKGGHEVMISRNCETSNGQGPREKRLYWTRQQSARSTNPLWFCHAVRVRKDGKLDQRDAVDGTKRYRISCDRGGKG